MVYRFLFLQACGVCNEPSAIVPRLLIFIGMAESGKLSIKGG